MEIQPRHIRMMADASGLEWRIWAHYAWVDGRHSRIMPDTKLAMWISCDQSALSRARTRLVEREMLLPIGQRKQRKMYKLPEWAREADQ